MQPVAENVWEHLSSCRYRGFSLSRRMTVIRLGCNGLWLHSPNALDQVLRAELATLGDVQFVVAPNTHHHAHLEDYRLAYPEAKLFAAPGLTAKRPELTFDATLEGGADFPWSSEIETHLVLGTPQLNESVFFHKASATLLVADLLFSFGSEDTWPTRLMARLDGTYGRPSVSWALRRELLADEDAFTQSLARVCSWPIERLLMAHARRVESINAEQLRQTLIS